MEQWKPIIDYEGIYEVSDYGRVRKVSKNGKYRFIAARESQKRDRLKVRLTNASGARKEYVLHRLIAEAFIKPLQKSDCVYHIDGIISNNAAWNLTIMDRKRIGTRTGGRSGSMAVIKIDISGKIVDAYRSAREAGRENYMSHQTVIDRCNGVAGRKSIQAPDGFVYCWDNSKNYHKVIEKIKAEARKQGIAFVGDSDNYFEEG